MSNSALAVCDICSGYCRYSDLKAVYVLGQKTGQYACKDCWDEDHPHLRVGMNIRPDGLPLPNARPEEQGLDYVAGMPFRAGLFMSVNKIVVLT